MNGLNPIAGSIYQASTVQRMQAGERDAVVRRTQVLQKNIGATGDTLEHSVESSDAIVPLNDEERAQDQRKRKPSQPDRLNLFDDEPEAPRLDLTA